MPADGEQGASGADGTEASPPRVIADRYEVRDRIGRGAFGEVFEVYDRRLSRLVALKTMPIGPATDAEAAEDLRRFYLEAQSVARLSHPGIVTVHDFGETRDFAWIVMELVIGETLKAVIDRGERPGVAETVRVVGALLEALHYAHGRGIVHRDVKPANILLALGAEEGLGEVRLADFGIARIGETQQTAIGQMIGTPATMSPEQLRGEVVDLRADLWSVGIILYEMLTAARPFPGGVPAIFHNILTLDPKPPSEVVPGLPKGFDTVIATALAKSPADRYRDAAQMAEAIRAVAVTEAPAAAAPAPPLPGLEPLPGLDAEVPDDATVKLPQPAAIAAAPAVRRSGSWGLLLGFLLGLLCGGGGVYVWMTREVARGAAGIAPAPSASETVPEPQAASGLPSGPPPAMPVPPEAAPAPPPLPAPEPLPAAPPPEPAPMPPPVPEPLPSAPPPPLPDRSSVPAPAIDAAPASEPAAREAAPAAVTADPVSASRTADGPEPPPMGEAPLPAEASAPPAASAAAPEPAATPAEAASSAEAPSREAPPNLRLMPPLPVATALPPPDARLAAPAPATPQPGQPPALRSLMPPSAAALPSEPAVSDPVPQPVADAAPVDPPPAVMPARRMPGAEIAAVQRVPPPRAASRDQVPGRCTPAQIATRSGNHAGFGRVVFAWRVAADYALQQERNGIRLRFSGPGCTPLLDRLAPPRNVRAILPDEGEATVWIETAPGAGIRHFRLPDGRLVIDVLDAPG